MSKQAAIPQSDWKAIPTLDSKKPIESDANRSFLAISDGYITAYTEPSLLIPAGDGRLVVSCVTHRMYCINTLSGEVSWTLKEKGSYNAGGDFKQTCYHNGVVYTGIVDTFFTAINPVNGEYLWQLNCGRKETSFSSPFLFRNDKVYFTSGDTAFCINLSTHKLEWKTKIADKESIYRRLPFFWKEYLVIHSANTNKHFSQENYAKKYKFYFFNLETGEIELMKDVKNPPKEWNFPLHLIDSTLWYASDDYALYSYDLEKGKETKLVLGDYTAFGDCFALHEAKLYTCLRVGNEKGLFFYDTASKELKKVFDEKEFDVNLRSLAWLRNGDYLYSYNTERFDSQLISSFSLSNPVLKRFTGVPKTGNEELDDMFNSIEGFNVANGVCYLATRFELEDGTDEDARICLWALW